MEPRKLSNKEEEKLQKQFPVLEEKVSEKVSEEKATIWDIAVMIFWLVIALIMVYLFYLTFTYQV